VRCDQGDAVSLVSYFLDVSGREQTMPASSAIHARVAKVLIQVLDVKEDEVKPSASLRGDLGAESIDFLDISFRLEREFGITIMPGELFSSSVSPDEPADTRDDRLTDEALDALGARLPYADLGDLQGDARLNQIEDVFTVDLLTRFVQGKLGRHVESNSDAEKPILGA
jgi:acyl carrier protein